MMEDSKSPEQPEGQPFIGPESPLEQVVSASIGGNNGEITVPGGTPEEPHDPESPAEPLTETTPAEVPSVAPQTALEAAGFVLPRNRARLLDENLVPSGLPGNETDKYYVRGYPDLLVRCDTSVNPDDFISAHDPTMRMADYGISVLPHERLSHNGRAYAVTAKVTGDSVYDLLRDNPGTLLTDEVDALFRKLGTWLLTETQESRPVAMDVMDTQQYMQGTIANNPERKLWLVDFPTNIGVGRDYASNVMYLTNGVLEAEQNAGVRLITGRLAVMDAIDFLPAVSRDVDQVTDLTMQALHTNTLIDFDHLSHIQ